MLPPINIPPDSGIKDWERLIRQACATADLVYDIILRADRIYQANNLATQIETGKPNQPNKFIGDSSFTYEGAKSSAEFSKTYKTYMTTPISIPLTPPAGMLLEAPSTEAVTPLSMTPLQIAATRAGTIVPSGLVTPTMGAVSPGEAIPSEPLGPPIVPPEGTTTTTEGGTP